VERRNLREATNETPILWERLLIRTDRADTPEMLACWEWLVGSDVHPLPSWMPSRSMANCP